MGVDDSHHFGFSYGQTYETTPTSIVTISSSQSPSALTHSRSEHGANTKAHTALRTYVSQGAAGLPRTYSKVQHSISISISISTGVCFTFVHGYTPQYISILSTLSSIRKASWVVFPLCLHLFHCQNPVRSPANCRSNPWTFFETTRFRRRLSWGP